MNFDVIAPSILSADRLNLHRDLQTAIQGGAQMFHIDIMDGVFVPNLSFGPSFVQAIRKITSLPLDVHLMTINPENYLDELIADQADLINLHVESTNHIYRAIQKVQAAEIKAGIVLNPGTSISSVAPLLPLVDNVLVMSVNPGFGGQQFIYAMTQKIQKLAQLRKQNADYTYTIEVDGGINEQTAKLCKVAGAQIFVAGSYVFDHDIAQQIARLKEVLVIENS
ncbi:ribulose-phosphate 3-epimerase [Bombilactobacillus thymidiniphilus]|uniref:Ribulose-phosphate 3-epimerase n=1 Tax=Bombilactobacillus thymidiniphilus TaxID=2923363 RepID=A0ABY4PCP3_9LACO|nr:ribulose-phosphate 3-epimerase [Bombilactobacillus thymidiniphilus]UQS83462.1 ribulose-phosphate 3-epimerase [Bombilactobacillus thymidiniphilus]